MAETKLIFAFSAGMLASINPCGFAMLPTFITYYLAGDDNQADTELYMRLTRAFWLGLCVTAGFLMVFVIAGVSLTVGGRLLIAITPWIGIAVGLMLIIMGLRFLFGRDIVLPIPVFQFDIRTKGAKGMFLYGVAYAAISLSCTLPIFLSVFAGSLTIDEWASGVALFFAYSFGMGTVVTVLALGSALFQGAITQYVRRLVPYIEGMSAVALILAGIYLIYYEVVLNPFLEL